MRLQGTLLIRLADLSRFRVEWDALAVSSNRPYCAPAWMLAWWRCVAAEGARLRAVAVTDEAGALAGLAPFWVAGGRSIMPSYRLLGSGLAAPIEPLARPGEEREVARIVAFTLARARPRPAVLALDGVPSGSAWPALLAASWPDRRRPRVRRDASLPIPTVDLSGESYEAWFAARRSHFRQQMRRYRRRIEEQGGRFLVPDTLEEAQPRLEAFGHLHETRWSDRGGSAALNARVERMLVEVASDLVADGRFRLWCIDADGRTVSAHLFVAAGSRASYWLGGFARDWKTHSPAIQTVLAAIEDGFSRGERLIDLGAGGQEYKYRLSDGEERLDWVSLVPIRSSYPVAMARFVASDLARAGAGRLPEPARERLKRWIRRA